MLFVWSSVVFFIHFLLIYALLVVTSESCVIFIIVHFCDIEYLLVNMVQFMFGHI